MNRQANRERFKAKTLQRTEAEMQRQAFVKRWREKMISYLSTTMQTFSCPGASDVERPAEAVMALLTHAARIHITQRGSVSALLGLFKGLAYSEERAYLTAVQSQWHKAWSDLCAALVCNAAMDLEREGPDGQPVPELTYPEPWAAVRALVLDTTPHTATELAEALPEEHRATLMGSLSGARGLSAEALLESYCQQARRASVAPLPEAPSEAVEDEPDDAPLEMAAEDGPEDVRVDAAPAAAAP
jgi:hypothetical protein